MRTGSLVGSSIAAIALATVAVPAEAQEQAPGESVSDLQAEVQALRDREKESLARIDALEQRLRALEASAGLAGAAEVPDSAASEMRGMGLAQAQAPAPVTPPPAAEAEPDRKAPAPTEAVELVTQSQQNSYGSRFSIEPGLTYSHFTNARLNLSGFLALDAIFLGLISIDEVEADVLTADLTARYGLTDRLQFDVNVPYIYRRSSFKSGGVGGDASGLAEETVTTNGLGDVSFGASYRLLAETTRRPDVVLQARVKAPTGKDPFGIELVEIEDTEGNFSIPARLATGTGTWGASAGVSLLKTIDPMVVFGNLTYFYNFPEEFDDLEETDGDQPGRARIGDAIQYGAGVAFALNDSSSLNLSFTQRFVRSTKVKRETDEDWQRVIGSNANIALLNVGANFALTDRMALLTNLSAGITEDAPDMTISLRVPYRF